MNKLFLFILISFRVVAAPCCGASISMPAVIAGDEKWQFGTSLSEGRVLSEASSTGAILTRGAEEIDVTQQMKISSAWLVSDRIQSGITIPLVRRVRGRGLTDSTSYGLSDVTLNFGYEMLPEFTYSKWKPRGFLFFSITAPTGVSEYETAEVLRVDVRGRGFWNFGVGGHLVKNLGQADVSLTGDIHRPLPRTFSVAHLDQKYELVPGWGGAIELSLGYRVVPQLKLLTSLGHNYEDSIRSLGPVNTIYSAQRFWTGSLGAQYSFTGGWVAGLNYSDQSILGGATNVALAQTWMVELRKNWER